MKIEIWSDLACPWCYLGLQRLHRALAEFEHADQVELKHRHFIIDPGQAESCPVVQYLTTARRLPEDVVKQQLANLAEMGSAEGINFDWQSCVQAPTKRIHRVLQAAGQLPGLDVSGLWLAVFRGIFEDGVDLSDLPQVVSLLAGLGVGEDVVRDAWENPSLDGLVLSDIQELLGMTVDSVPFYLFDGTYGAAGAHSTPKMAQALSHAWQESQPSNSTQENFCG